MKDENTKHNCEYQMEMASNLTAKLTMKRQKQLRMSTFMVNRKGNKAENGKENSVDEQKNNSNNDTVISRKRTRSSQSKPVASIFERPKTKPKRLDLLAENLGTILGKTPQYLTSGNYPVSWILHVPNWFPSEPRTDSNIGTNAQPATTSPSTKKPVQNFDEEWKIHPNIRKQLKVFGRPVSEKRWSQAWGKPIHYSGMIDNNDRPLTESPNLPWLIHQVNTIMKSATGNKDVAESGTQVQKEEAKSGCLEFHEYNACLQNWYRPEDSIGLHADDETYLYRNYPIFSVSWGGPRRFLLRPKETPRRLEKNSKTSSPPVEVLLKDGDLLIMGGACQTTHKHEVPKPRKKDPVTSNRISWTIRAIKP